MPVCPICSKEMKYINNSHLKSHGLTPTQFKEMYPDVEAIPKEIREANKRNSAMGIKGSKESSANQYKKRIEAYERNPKKCLECRKSLTYKQREYNCCSKSCRTSLCNKNREVIYSEEGKKALRESASKNLNSLTYKKINSSKRSISQLFNVCQICKNSFLVTSKSKTKKTCSIKCYGKWRSLNNSKEIKTFGKWGYYQGIYCASSWELAFLIYNKDLGKNIKRCDLTFEYSMNDEDKVYFPDFLMDATIYEVKGRELEDVAFKTQAVIDAGYKIELVRRKEINPIIKAIKEKYRVKDVTELYDKKT